MKKILLVVLILGAVMMAIILGLIGLAVLYKHRASALLLKPPEHGTSFVVEADLTQVHSRTNAFALLNEPLRKRLSAFGVRIYLESVSESRIRVVTPITDANDAERARKWIDHRGFLEFRLVKEDSDDMIANNLPIPPKYEKLTRLEPPQNGKPQPPEVVVVGKTAEPGLSGGIIKYAWMGRGNLGEPEIEFKFTAEAAKRFGDVTSNNIGRRLAIILDGQLYSAPRIVGPIYDSAVITGHFDPFEATMLANAIDYPLPVSIAIVQTDTF